MQDVLTWLVVCSLIVYRVTRFFVSDSLIDVQRKWVFDHLMGTTDKRRLKAKAARQPGDPRVKLYELLSCPYCFSVHVAWMTTLVLDHYRSVEMPVFFWVATAGGAMMAWRWAET